ncbi:NAD(P)/FAD-dependent oxidoreductase [Sedimentibacter sp. zth1]|uniref:NAD(P)/FAD-dependent oxidoreductase n=1 Tax=Sedimentibacter sp. zth1 TaxID=2816908 RepID=UPI001A92F060|nr:NAD(P)/FAD-dependent oxidoreductase [Sedimentibacter sp. zth1]QSX06982.1 NAD(P)/FAD-dependent oxidoreductase [Sedimentibacter sp. zth1]
MKTRVAIIGGGASGLMAAIVAAKNNADVTIYEKSNRVGKKILATGNGRCNYTNINTSVNNYHGKNVDIINDVLDIFSVQNTLDFFEDIGIYPYFDESGKVYPYSLQASSVLDNLRLEAVKHNVKELTECNIRNLRKSKGQFDIITDDKIYNADKIIICTGGRAGSQFGCSGDGYKMADSLGHKTVTTFPALVQLKLESVFLKKISGVRYEGAVTSFVNSKVIRKEDGEILFTDYGISGPPVLQLSRETIEKLNTGQKVYLQVDSFPNLSKNELFELLKERFIKLKDRSLADTLIGLLNKKLIPVVLSEALNNYKDLTYSKLNKKQIYSIVNILKEWKFRVIGHNGWNQAQTTAGGVSLENIDINTFESKKVKGLYFAGEILDIDGDCGGFNLQFAWSSGYIAGYNASK